MTNQAPVAELDRRFSGPNAQPTDWADARRRLDAAKTYWIATVRPDSRPHVTTIAAVWIDETIHFVTGRTERKARNLARNPQVVVTTGCNGWKGLDIVLEGEAVRVTDPGRLRQLVESFTTKYDDFFGFRMIDGQLRDARNTDEPLAYAVRAAKAFAFGKGDSFSQTGWVLGEGVDAQRP